MASAPCLGLLPGPGKSRVKRAPVAIPKHPRVNCQLESSLCQLSQFPSEMPLKQSKEVHNQRVQWGSPRSTRGGCGLGWVHASGAAEASLCNPSEIKMLGPTASLKLTHPGKPRQRTDRQMDSVGLGWGQRDCHLKTSEVHCPLCRPLTSCSWSPPAPQDLRVSS